jgi:hypothetical protein
LVDLERRSAVFDRVESRGCLPARLLRQKMDWTITRVEPLTPDGRPPVLHRVMNGGILGLRPPWRHDLGEVTNQVGECLPAMWSRQGSGIVGPVPAPGKSVRVVLNATSGRAVPQTLLIRPPWATSVTAMAIEPRYSSCEVDLPRPLSDTNVFPLCTGVYRLTAEVPYDPTKEGFLGWDRDLGALIHSVEMSTVR